MLNPLSMQPLPYRLIREEQGTGHHRHQHITLPVTQLTIERMTDKAIFTAVIATHLWTEAKANSIYDQQGNWLIADIWLFTFCSDTYSIDDQPQPEEGV